MSIASELQRISNAKNVLLEKAIAMGLTVGDGDSIADLNEQGNVPIEILADAYDDIAVNNDSNVVVNKAEVTVGGGYYPNGVKKNVNTALQEEPTITVDENGKITASATQQEGYVLGGTKTATKDLETQAARTITPDKITQVAVQKGKFTTGAIEVAPIPTKYIDTTDADAIAANILKNKTAYVGGAKVTGTMENRGNVGTIEIDATSATPVYTILSGYYDGGEVTISDSLENALKAI